MSKSKWSNQNKGTAGARRNAYPERSGNPLSATQKAKVCVLAGQAAAAMGLVFGTAKAGDAWRKGEMEKVTGIDSLTRCSQEHFLLLVAHFQDLSGESGQAFVSAMAHGTEAARVALNKVKDACAKAGFAVAYAETICRRQYGVDLEDATKEQLWQVCWTVRNRKPKKDSRGGAETRREDGDDAGDCEQGAVLGAEDGNPF